MSEDKYLAVILRDHIYSMVDQLHNYMTQNNINHLITRDGLCVSIPVIKDKFEFIDDKSGKRMKIEDNKLVYIDKLILYTYKEKFNSYDAANILLSLFNQYPTIDAVITSKGWIYFVNKPKTGYQGFSGCADKVWNGFEFIDVESGQIMIFIDNEIQLKN